MPEGLGAIVSYVGSALGGLGSSIGGGLTSLGVGANTAGIIGTGAADAVGGAASGATEAGITGGNPLTGAEFGAVTGGLGGGSGALASNLGLSSGIGSALGGAVGGAGFNAATGGNPVTGALTGGITGYGVSSLNPPTGVGAASPVGGGSAVSTAAPSSVAASGATPDLTGGIAPVKVTPVAPNIQSALGLDASGNALPTGIGGVLKELGITPGQAVEGTGFLFNALKPKSGDQKQLEADASQLGQEGQMLQSYLNNGTLPPGLQQSVNLATNDAIAGIKSTYANLGASGSSAETQAIADAKLRAQSQATSYATDLLKTGLQTSGMSAQLLGSILSVNESQDKDLTDALASFAAAGGGGAVPAGFKVQ